MSQDTDILLVEDSPTQAELARHILEGGGYKVFCAADGGKALEMMKERRFAIILSDIEMPGMNGYDFCRKAKDDPATKDIPFILLTQLSAPGDIITGLECGADNFIAKPFEAGFLLSWIKLHLVNTELRKSGGGRAKMEFTFSGRKHSLTSDRAQLLDILLSTYEAAVDKNLKLAKAQRELELLNSSLETKVEERTAHLEQEMQSRLKAEEELCGSEERYRALFEKARDCILLLEIPSEGHAIIMDVNAAALSMHGYSREEVLGKPITFLNAKDTPDTMALERANGAQGAEGSLFEARHRRKDGSVFDTEASVAEVEVGGKRCLLAISRDITARKEAEAEHLKLEKQFQQAQKMEAVGRLAGGIAHDFNNLLTAIDGYTGFLLKSLAPDDKRREDAVEIQKAAESAAALTRQLLMFSRRQILQLKVLDCNATIGETQKLLKRIVGENIDLALDLAGDKCRIKADPGQVEQIIMNLAVNAKDAMPKGGKITIKTENMELGEKDPRMLFEVHPGPHVLISVTDTGSGIDPEVMTHIFDPFFTTKEAGKGTGLGLATVYGIVKQSGGNISVESQLGRGAAFKIYLPRMMDEVEAVAAPAPAVVPGGGETILVVEDDATVRGIALRALREYGYTVLEAGDPEDAARICESNAGKISLVLTDTIMPGMNGYEFYGMISKRWPGVRVIFMSGYTNSELVIAHIADEDLPFIQKPFSADGLAGKVREVLDAPAAVKA
jgi:PAS domain S-box-containing protein